MKPSSPLLRRVGENQGDAAGDKAQALHILSEVTASLASEHDIEGLLSRFLRTMIRLAGASAGVVRVVTTDGQHLRLLAAVGLPPEVAEKEQMVDIDCGVCGSALKNDEIRFEHDMRPCAERTHLPFFGQCRSMVVVPLEHNGRLLGAYNLYMTEERPIPEDISLLFCTISEQLGMALENARLMRENLRMGFMNERQMMANEVHDSLAQTMAYMKMRVELLREALLEYESGKALKYSGDIQQALDEAYASLRELLTQFRSRMDPLGLVHALEEIAARFHDRHGITLEFENRIPDLNLTVDQEVQVFHIVQEALANVVRHSGARHASLVLDLIDDQYAFTVEDDGRGVFVVGAQPDLRHHFGISIMSERAQRLGGTIEIANRPQGGARLRLLVPATHAKAEPA